MPYDKKPGAAVRMYDSKGKPAGLMAEGSMAYMESIGQEKSNLMRDMPIDNRGISQMSPYKLHGDPKTPHTDPELTKKEGKAKKSVSTSGDTTTTTTTQRMSGTGAQGGFASGTGYDLDEVIIGLDRDSSSTTINNTSDSGGALPTKRKKKKRKTYSKVGNFLRGVNPLSTRHERVRARTRLGQDRLL